MRSVGGLLDRLDEMEKSDVPGAKEALAGLRKKGLTDEVRQRMHELVEATRKAFDGAAGENAEEEKIRQLAQDRLDAYDRVNAWYIDWAEAVRKRLTYHQAVRLGITAPKGGRQSSIEEPVPEEPTVAPAAPAVPTQPIAPAVPTGPTARPAA